MAFTKLPRSTVYDVAKKFFAAEAVEEGSGTPARKKLVQERTARSSEMINQLQTMVDEDPSVSMRKLAMKLQVDEATVRRQFMKISDIRVI